MFTTPFVSLGQSSCRFPQAQPRIVFLTAILICSNCAESVFAVTDAKILFDNGNPDFQNAHVSDTDQPFQQAGDFVLPAGRNTITAVQFFGLYGSTFGAIPSVPLSIDDFTIRFFEDDSGKPAVDWLYEFRVGDISRHSLGVAPQLPRHEYFRYEVEIPATALAANNTYWLSVFNSTEFDSEFNWFWARSMVGGYWQNRTIDGEEWDHPRLSDNSIYYYESAFQLIGVPEPSSSALLGCGISLVGGLVLRCRR